MITTFSEIPPSPSTTDISLCYFEACNNNQCTYKRMSKDHDREHSLWSTCMISSIDMPLTTFTAKKKYKLVAWKVRPILDTLPSHFHIKCNITGNLLANLPTLSLHPPPFIPCGCYTKEQRAKMDNLHSSDFLWPTKCNLLHHFISIQNEGFAWDNSKHGHFHEDFFPPVKSPIVAHTPWVERNIPILPSIYDKVCRIICVKMDAGVYEWSNLSYHSHWFCIVNKDTTSLHLIHSLEPLNVVTIQHSRVTPFTEQIAKQFAGCTCGGILNLYVGYNECTQLYNLSDTLRRASPH